MSIPIIGHDRQIDCINKARTAGRLPHAYCFHGPDHVGKLTIALALAQSFFCPQAKQNEIRSVCGACDSCRAIAEFRCPYVIMLDTNHTLVSKKETRKEIPIEDIRELKRVFSFAPQGNTMRLAIINEVDKMSTEAANAFLKLLEEPGDHTLIILITSHQDLLLPTIISRTQSIGFLPVAKKEMSVFLHTIQNISRDNDEDLLMLAGGRPGVLFQLCADSSYAAHELSFFRNMHQILRSRDIISALRISDQASKDPICCEKIIFSIITYLRTILISSPQAVSLSAAASAIKRIDRIAHLLDSTNANPRLCTDVLFLEAMKSSPAL